MGILVQKQTTANTKLKNKNFVNVILYQNLSKYSEEFLWNVAGCSKKSNEVLKTNSYDAEEDRSTVLKSM